LRESEHIGRRRTSVAIALVLAGFLAASLAPAGAAAARGAPARIIFPVVGKAVFSDDFGAPRWQGSHEGNDILADRKTPVVAVEAGTVKIWARSASAGCMLYLYGASGATYLYIHLNNDLGKTNDNKGTCKPGTSYAPGLQDGQKVLAGQLLGFVGDSGDADGGPTHLHFELHPGGGAAVSPFRWLKRAVRPLFPLHPADGERGTSGAATLTLSGTVVGLGPPEGGEPPAASGSGTSGAGSGTGAGNGAGGGSGAAGGNAPPPPPPPQGKERRAAIEAGSVLTIRVSLVAVSTGGRYTVTRNVTLTVASGAVLERASGGSANADQLVRGAKVTVTTAPVRLSSDAQLAKAGVLAAARITLAA
jgi:hypothetical protein